MESTYQLLKEIFTKQELHLELSEANPHELLEKLVNQPQGHPNELLNQLDLLEGQANGFTDPLEFIEKEIADELLEKIVVKKLVDQLLEKFADESIDGPEDELSIDCFSEEEGQIDEIKEIPDQILKESFDYLFAESMNKLVEVSKDKKLEEALKEAHIGDDKASSEKTSSDKAFKDKASENKASVDKTFDYLPYADQSLKYGIVCDALDEKNFDYEGKIFLCYLLLVQEECCSYLNHLFSWAEGDPPCLHHGLHLLASRHFAIQEVGIRCDYRLWAHLNIDTSFSQ